MADDVIGKVFPSVPQPGGDAPAVAAALGVATIAAGLGPPARRDGLLRAGALGRLTGAGAVAGWAVTAWNPPGDNTMLSLALAASRPGDVLVVSTPTDGAAQWGDLAQEWATAIGLVGVLVDGSARDVGTLRHGGPSVWARTVDPRQAGRAALGYVNAPVEVGARSIWPGDLVVADDDGVLVLAPEAVAGLLESASQRAEREALVRERTRGGEPWATRTGPPYDAIEYVSAVWRQGIPGQQ